MKRRRGEEEKSPEGTPAPPLTPSSARADWLCRLIIIAAALGVWGPALFTGRVLLPADIVPLMPPWGATAHERFPDYRFAQNQLHGPIFEYYSWRHYARQRIRAGEVPLWNPDELGGNVLLANSQSAVLYPPNVLLDVLPLWLGIDLVTVLHTLLTGLFMFSLLRVIRLRPVAALTGALVWMFCGLQIVWTEFQTPTATICWFPAMLWCWEMYWQRRDWRWAVFGSGTAVALALLAGHLQFAFYGILALVLWSLGRGVLALRRSGVQTSREIARSPESPDRPITRSPAIPPDSSPLHELLCLAGALAFGIVLSLSTMLPVMEMSRMNFRGEDTSYTASIALRLPPANLFTLVQPNLFGNPRDYVAFDAEGRPTDGHSYWGKFDFIEYNGYVGIPALILGLIGLLSAFRRGRSGESEGWPQWYWAALAVLGLLLALGTPLCAVFYYGLPGYKQFHATARALCLFSFGMAGLAAYGVEMLALAPGREHGDPESRNHEGEGPRRRITTAAIAVVALGGLAAFPGMGLASGEWRVLFTDQWFGYEVAGLERFALFTLLTAAVCGLLLARKREPASRAGSTPSPHRLIASSPHRLIWLLPALAFADLIVWGGGFNPVTNPRMLGYPTETTDFLKTIGPARAVSLETPGRGIKSFIVPNYNVVCGYREAQGADSLHTARIHHLFERVVKDMRPGPGPAFPDPNTIHFPAVTHPIFDLLNVRYVATLLDLDPTKFRRLRDAELTIYQNPRALGPVWVVGAMDRVTNVDAAVDRMEAPTFDGRRTALVDQDVGPLDPVAAGSPARLTLFSPHRLEVDVDSRGRGLLVLSEIAYPGWRAAVDGRPARIVTADWILRAVTVGPGRHRVVLTYNPTSYRLGLYLSALALTLLAGAVAYRFRVRRPEA